MLYQLTSVLLKTQTHKVHISHTLYPRSKPS